MAIERPVGKEESPIAEKQSKTDQGHKEGHPTTSTKSATQNSWVCNGTKTQCTTQE
jgi:hypothetical protein